MSSFMYADLGELQTNLCVLHPALLLGLDATALSQIWCLLEQLQVRHITPREVVEHHVIPEFRSGAWKVSLQFRYPSG